MKFFYLIIFFLMLSIQTYALTYVDSSDPRSILDQNRFFDPNDGRSSEPTRYIDWLPYNPAIQTINGVKPSFQNINLIAGNAGISINPNYENSSITFLVDSNLSGAIGGFDVNAVIFADNNGSLTSDGSNFYWHPTDFYLTTQGYKDLTKNVSGSIAFWGNNNFLEESDFLIPVSDGNPNDCLKTDGSFQFFLDSCGGLSEADGNLLYVKLNPLSEQVISGTSPLTLPDANLNVDIINAGSSPSAYIDLVNGFIYSIDGGVTIDWENAVLRDLSNHLVALEWEARIANDSGENLSIDWENRTLNHADTSTSIDWENNELKGNWTVRGILSVDDLNASCADLNNGGCLGGADANGLYIQKNPLADQTISAFNLTINESLVIGEDLTVDGNLFQIFSSIDEICISCPIGTLPTNKLTIYSSAGTGIQSIPVKTIKQDGSPDANSTQSSWYAVSKAATGAVIQDGFGNKMRFAIDSDAISETELGHIGFRRFGSDTNGTFFIIQNFESSSEGDETFTILPDGNVGVGNKLPAFDLQVFGFTDSNNFCLDSDCITSWAEVSGGTDTTLDTNAIARENFLGAQHFWNGDQNFNQADVNGIGIDSSTASRLLQTNASKRVVSVADLTAWIAGTTNQITVANDGDGTVTLSLPQNIDTGADLNVLSVSVGATGSWAKLFQSNVLGDSTTLQVNADGDGTGFFLLTSGATTIYTATTTTMNFPTDNYQVTGNLNADLHFDVGTFRSARVGGSSNADIFTILRNDGVGQDNNWGYVITSNTTSGVTTGSLILHPDVKEADVVIQSFGGINGFIYDTTTFDLNLNGDALFGGNDLRSSNNTIFLSFSNDDASVVGCLTVGSATECTNQGRIEAGDGLVGTPAFAFDADPDNGIYRIGTNDWGMAANGVLQASVDVNGFHVDNCPTGFTDIGIVCLQTAEKGSGTIDAASEGCFDTFAGTARLPHFVELSIGFNNFALTDETDDDEWTADPGSNALGTSWVSMDATTGTNPSNVQTTGTGASLAYRCAIPYGAG